MTAPNKKTYTLGKIKQLIDLNDDSTNFDLSFTVTCHDDTPFQMLVVDQTTLDNNPELEYKNVKNSISGNIVSDKNIYQNYFLILKSEKVCKVDVETIKKVLPKTPTEVLDSGDNQQLTEEQSGNLSSHDPNYPHNHLVEDNKFVSFLKNIKWKTVAIITSSIIGGFILIGFLYKKLFKSMELKNDKSSTNSDKITETKSNENIFKDALIESNENSSLSSQGFNFASNKSNNKSNISNSSNSSVQHENSLLSKIKNYKL